MIVTALAKYAIKKKKALKVARNGGSQCERVWTGGLIFVVILLSASLFMCPVLVGSNIIADEIGSKWGALVLSNAGVILLTIIGFYCIKLCNFI